MLRGLGEYDLVVGVGGGYLRAGHPREALVTALAHGPQLWRAGRVDVPAVYLPQSVGPFSRGTRWVFRRLIGRLDRIYLRDDRSVEEAGAPRSVRFPDLALLVQRHLRTDAPEGLPVLTVRAVHGAVTGPTPADQARRAGLRRMRRRSSRRPWAALAGTSRAAVRATTTSRR